MSNTYWLKLQEYSGAIHDGDPRFYYTYWVVGVRCEGGFMIADDSEVPIEESKIVERREIPEPEESEEEILRREHALVLAETWSEAFNAGAKEWEANLRTRGLLKEDSK